MEIGFINFNQEALNKANKVLQLLQGQGAVDELGLGRIRDAFSNMMFPGMSTLQTKAKYFLLLPALYSFLERTKIHDAREARLKVLEYEISLTHRLLAGSSGEDLKGIIGSTLLQKHNTYVKNDPASIYHTGLETYGLIKTGGNIFQLIAERSAAFQNMPKRHSSADDDECDAQELNGIPQFFLTCGQDYDFRGNDPLSIILNYKEASFLKYHIENTTSGSMLGYLLESGLYKTAILCDFESLGEILKDNVPASLLETYMLARRYSRFAYLLRVRYAMLYDRAVDSDKAVEEERCFFEYLEKYRFEFSPVAVEEIIKFISLKAGVESRNIFFLKASEFISQENWEALDSLIYRREIEIKTLKRSKLANAGDYERGKAFITPEPLSFRWNSVVRNILTEIKTGLENE